MAFSYFERYLSIDVKYIDYIIDVCAVSIKALMKCFIQVSLDIYVSRSVNSFEKQWFYLLFTHELKTLSENNTNTLAISTSEFFCNYSILLYSE